MPRLSSAAAAVGALFAVSFGAAAQTVHRLMPSPSTVAWGYYDAAAAPVLRIRSGDVLVVGTLITSTPERLQAAGVPPAQIEPALREITRTVTNKGPGGHILTGPIYVEGADSGDVLEVRIQRVELAIPYAYNAFGVGRGFLPEDFPYARMRIIPLDRRRMVARLSRDDAYMLTSVACDVDITELVDGNVGVHVMIPKSILRRRRDGTR